MAFDLGKTQDLNELCESFLKTELAIEIGCGNGHFLSDFASIHPNTQCLGIDLRPGRIAKAVRKKVRLELENLHFVAGDALEVLALFPESLKLGRVMVNFPDPWPKFRHRKHRLNQEANLEKILSRLEPAGDFIWVSDYYPQIVDILHLMDGLVREKRYENLFQASGYGDAIEGYPKTLYEQRWRAIERRIYYLWFKRLV